MIGKIRLSVALMLVAGLTLVPVAPAAAALISTAQEIQIGRDAAMQLEAEYGLVPDPAAYANVALLGGRIAAASSRPNLPWTFRVLNTSQVNAISLPGGFIYVTRGMTSFVQSEAELAFVLAHEIGHVDRRHHVSLIERHMGLSLLFSLIFGGRADTTAQIANVLGVLLTRGFSREAEFQADQVGVSLVHRAGFDAAAGLSFMERLRTAQGRDPSRFQVLFQTHPALADRITRVREQLRTLGYRAGVNAAAA
ncbi:MAG: M48 family metalloprotease [bacterium]